MTKSDSKKTRRQNKILDTLKLNPTIRVNELAQNLGVSSETIRRDLAELDESGQVTRTYGGAVKANEFEPALTDRLKLHNIEREQIARRAVSFIGDVPSLLIGGGATTFHFARALRNINRKITVITATFSVAAELATNPLIEVMSLPGIVEPKEGLVCGLETAQYIARYKVPFAIMGASAIDEEGVSEALLSAAQVYSAMIEHADSTIILADNSKFGARSLQSILKWGKNTVLITDTTPPPSLRNSIENKGGTICVASENEAPSPTI